jgi:hypothetical protein
VNTPGGRTSAQFGPEIAERDLRPCADAGQRLPARLDTILVADATGDTAEFWFYRGECEAVIRTGMAGQRPNTDLVAPLDSVLG